MTLVKAMWNGPFVGDRGPAQEPLNPGDIVEVSPELLESGHWVAVADTPAAQPVSPAPAKAATSSPSEGGS